jgi:hypothetical protein
MQPNRRSVVDRRFLRAIIPPPTTALPTNRAFVPMAPIVAATPEQKPCFGRCCLEHSVWFRY